MPSDSALRDVLEERVRFRKDVIEKLRAYARRLNEERGRVSVILFGSFARGGLQSVERHRRHHSIRELQGRQVRGEVLGDRRSLR